MKHEFHPEAELEFEKAIQYYKQRGNNLGRRFADEVRATIIKILATPDRWRILQGEVRRCFVRIFPYAVLYKLEDDRVLIVAIVHNKREPGYWHERVRMP